MGECLSMDLRERMSAYVAEGGSRRGAGRRFAVSASCAVKLIKRESETGSLAPAPQGRPKGSGKLAPVEGFLIAAVEARPDITMPELAERLRDERGVGASPAMLSRFLCARGLSYKKNTDGRGVRTRRAA